MKLRRYLIVLMIMTIALACIPDQLFCNSTVVTGSGATATGWTWYGITVGRSTAGDLISKHGEPITKEPFSISKELEGCEYQYNIDNNIVFFTILGGRVYEIEIRSPGLLLRGNNENVSLGDILQLYGKPDLIGFNKVYENSRTVVWLDKGVQAVVAIGHESSVDGTLSIDIDKAMLVNLSYFSPTTLQDYFSTVTSYSYSETLPKSDVMDPYPRDPFDWKN